MPRCCPIVELRQYTLHPGGRSVLTDLFDSTFVAPQNAVGAHVMGQFHDLDDADRFVWLRGFESMQARAAALTAFYDGPIWKANRQAANATMLDASNVLLLQPIEADSGFDVEPGDDAAPAGVLTATIHDLEPTLVAPFVDFFRTRMQPMLEAHGAAVMATFVSETSPNNFARLPIRADAHALVWFARFADEQAQQAFADRLRSASGWRESVPDVLLPAFMRKPEVLRLSPTSGSLLR